MSDKIIKIFEDCKLVNGHLKSIIYDLGRKKYEIISQKQALWFQEIDFLSWNTFQEKKCSKEYKSFVKFLLDNEYAFLCDDSLVHLFPRLEETWDYPGILSNAILIRSNKSEFNIQKTLSSLEELGCRHLQIILIDDYINLTKIKQSLEFISKSSLKSLELILSYNSFQKIGDRVFTEISNKVETLYVTNSPNFELTRKSNSQSFNIIFITNHIDEYKKCQSPDPNYFIVDIGLYMESHYHNTFFNKKVIIDSKDNLLNSIDGKSFGNINNVSLLTIVNTLAFQEYWNISKENLEPCNVCEFRHMCVDSRTPIKSGKDWVFDNMCDYNPYSGSWSWEQESITSL